MVSVTAVNSSDRFSWANYGAADPANNFYGIDIAAPGESMLSTYLTKENYYAYLMGTSMASPFVASCFALLKSAYPDSSNDWLVDRMLDNTDPIDDINPDYAGELGTGRVNMLKALVFDKWPSLSYVDHVEIITDGDADSVLNPGETVNLMIEIKNDTGWTAATNIQGILRSNSKDVIILDSIGVWSTLNGNSNGINDSNGFTVQFLSSAMPDDYSFELELESNADKGLPYRKTLSLNISLYLDQQGFPFYGDTEVEASPLFVDINNNGMQEIIFADKSGEIYVVDYRGNILNGFPVSLGSQTSGLAVADIDLDDTLEIVATGFDKLISVYDITGKHEWNRHTDFYITTMPAIGNLDNDPELEVVVGSYDQNVYVLNHDSTDVIGFPYALGQILRAGVALADIDNDGVDEIVYTAYSGTIGVLDVNTDSVTRLWSATTSSAIASEPQVVITGNGSGVILFGNESGDMYGFNFDGTQRFMLDGEGAIKASPAIYIANGYIMAYFGTTSGYLYKINFF